MAIRVQNRRGTESRWLEVNPVLLDGEIAFVKDKNYIKIGDGIKTFSELDKISGGDSGELPTNLIYFSETQPEEDCDIIGEIIDNTDSTRKDAAASANMARYLNEKVEIVKDDIDTLSDDVYVIGADGSKIPKSFIDMWNAVAGEDGGYNLETGYFELCEIKDIDYEEAMIMWDYRIDKPASSAGWNGYPIPQALRINLDRFPSVSEIPPNCFEGYDCSSGGILNLSNRTFRCRGVRNFYSWNLAKVNAIIDMIYMGTVTSMIGGGMKELWLKNVSKDISLSVASGFKRECVVYLIENRKDETPFTLILHSSAYARLTQEDLDLATSKNITIIT